MTADSPAGLPALRPDTDQLDAAIGGAERDAVVVWRGERIPFRALESRIAAIDDRGERDGLYAGWIEALDALNPLYRERLATRRTDSEVATALSPGSDVEALTLELEELSIQSETVYYAALRRYLALIGIEQGDATLADLWHVRRGSAWSQWFGQRELDRAVGQAGREPSGTRHGEGWRSGESGLGGSDTDDGVPAMAVSELYRSLVGDPGWLGGALQMAPDEIASFADFVAFIRLWRLRRRLAQVHYEMRLYRTDEEAVQRAYFSGIVGHTTGVVVPEAAYLVDIGAPFSSVTELGRMMLAGAIGERLSSRFGSQWWANEEARAHVATLASMSNVDDVVAQFGYSALDWRPVLRQIRTRLIGEMSGYGGPNITTRAGTRKV
ncbi:MAG: hypothetical protein M3406_15805 [Chloroflexota bacterium]|nr:hypothetical protein [Chloroflexota bacterium]